MTVPNTYKPSFSIGGTDAGAIIGVNRYMTVIDVYNRLCRPELVKPREDNIAMQQGRYLEQYIINTYQEQTLRQVQRLGDQKLTHPDYDFLHASPDGAIIRVPEGDQHTHDGFGILECKSFGQWNFKKTKEEGIDPSYYAQLQHYLGVTGYKWGAFAVFGREAWELFHFDVERDDEYIEQMQDACIHFWTHHVIPQVPPEGAMPTVETPRAMLGGREEVHTEPEWETAFRDLRTATEAFKLAEHQKNLARARVEELMGDRTHVTVPGIGKVSWAEKTRRSFDQEKFKAEHPEIDIVPFQKLTAVREFRPTFK